MRSGSTLRATGLMTAGALAVHHLRYLLAPEAVSHGAASAHVYLSFVSPLVFFGMMLACVHLLSVMSRARSGRHVTVGHVSFRRAWVAAAIGLGAIFVAQELAEGLISEGHPPAIEIFQHGGLAVFPIAIAVGAIVALCLRGAQAAIAQAARRAPRAAARRELRAFGAPPRVFYPVRRTALTNPGAGRAPPLLSM